MNQGDVRIFPTEEPHGYIFILLNQKTDDGYYDAIIISEEREEDDNELTYIVELCEVQPTAALLQDNGEPLTSVPSEYLAILLQTTAEFATVTSTMPVSWDPELSMDQNMSSTSTWVDPV